MAKFADTLRAENTQPIPDTLWHSNTSSTVYTHAVQPLPELKETAIHTKEKPHKVSAVFASGGPMAEQYAYAYALKLDKIPTDTNPTPGNMLTVRMLYNTIFALIDNEAHFLERMQKSSSHIYEVSSDGFTITAGTEYICEGPAKIKQRLDLVGEDAVAMVMGKGIQVLFTRDFEALKTFFTEDARINLTANLSQSDHEARAWNLLRQMIKDGNFTHYNAKMDINPVDFIKQRTAAEKSCCCVIL